MALSFLVFLVLGTRCASALLFPGLGVSLVVNDKEFRNLKFGINDFKSTSDKGPWELSTPDITAIVAQRVENGHLRWDLKFMSLSQRVAQFSFPLLVGTPMDGRDNLFQLVPFLGGIFVRDGHKCPALDSKTFVYPGDVHAPYLLLCTPAECLMAAATTWEPHTVRPHRHTGNDRRGKILALDFLDGYPAKVPVSVSVLLDSFHTTTGTEAWQAAILAYREWLQPHVTRHRVKAGRGMMSVQLENMRAFNLTDLDALWGRWRDEGFGRLQLWGQMSNWCGDPKYAVPPLKPGEKVGCCELEQTMHQRYLDQSLPAWVEAQVRDGYDVGYYTRPTQPPQPMVNNLTWIRRWLDRTQNEYHGNAQYVDTLARTHEGSPTQLLGLFKQGLFPDNIVTEGWIDFYPFAALLSGYHHGFTWANGGDNTSTYDMKPFGAHNNGTFVNMVRLLMGDTDGYFGSIDSEVLFGGWRHGYFSERLAFLLGALPETPNPEENCTGYPPPHPGTPNKFWVLIHRIRSELKWWSRRMTYKDTVGIETDLSDRLVDVRRFSDAEGRDVLLVDNPKQVEGLTVKFLGKNYAVPHSAPLSYIQI